jgi:hypothetical protein
MNELSKGNPLKYIGLLFFIFLVLVGYGGYTFYNYFTSSVMMQGYSFLSDDLKNMEYLFENKDITKEDCLKECKTDYLCSGVTYDASTNACYGVKNGKLRTDDNHIYAWAKDRSYLSMKNDDNILVSWTKDYQKLLRRQLPTPIFLNKFSVSFWFQIDNWYTNYAVWRNIFHHGSQPEENMHLTTWGDVITKIPKQRLGLWLAPYTNNIRCVVGTKIPFDLSSSTEHPGNQLCKGKNCYIKAHHTDTKTYYDLEFKDIINVDIGIPNMITIVIYDKSFNIYLNGKLVHNINLDGEPLPLNNDCFIKSPKSFDGHFMNFRYWDTSLTSGNVQQLYTDELKNINNLIVHHQSNQL